MEAYSNFAAVYDEFMDETPYEQWKKMITDTLKKYDINDGIILDLGCGTGVMTEMLACDGYDMIGVDLSQDMLGMAVEKRDKSGHDILYLCQDMTEFELYGTVRAIICICDSINYLLESEDILKTFKLVNNYLDPGGIFIFDFNTKHKYRDVIGDTCIAEARDECSFIWDNYYDEESGINEYDITFFVREEDGRYGRFDEVHYQKGYTLDAIKTLTDKAGLEFVSAYDYEQDKEPDDSSERITVVVKEKGKRNE